MLLRLAAARTSPGLVGAGLLVAVVSVVVVVVAASGAGTASTTSLGLAMVVGGAASCPKPLVTKGLIWHRRTGLRP